MGQVKPIPRHVPCHLSTAFLALLPPNCAINNQQKGMHLLLKQLGRSRKAAGSGGSNASASGGSGSSQPLVRPRQRLWLVLLLALLALIALLANLILLYASIDQFVALLRQQCRPEDDRGGREETAQKEEQKLPRLRISTETDVRLFSPRPSPSSVERGRTKGHSSNWPKSKSSSRSRQKTTLSGWTRKGPSSSTPSSAPSPPHQRTTLFMAKIRPKEVTDSSPRLRLTAADLAKAKDGQKDSSLPPLATSTSGTSSIAPNPLPTVVTALLDIGRDRWSQYGRTMQQYHRFMRHLLQLRVPMVVIVDEKSLEFVHRERARIGWGNQTRVRQIALSQLPLFAFQSQVQRIMRSELANWRPEWDAAMASHPEASHPEYALLVNSKPFFLAQAAAENPFGTESFVWLDAGYGHGERSIFPAQWQWRPTFPPGRISLIKLTPPSDPADRYGLQELYRQDISVLSGGFVAGDRLAVEHLHRLHYRKFVELVQRGKVDDDQTLLVLLANDHPELFHISHGDWFDAFELF